MTPGNGYFAEVFAEQQLTSALHPPPSAARQLAPVLQQSETQQAEPSVQQLPSALQTLPSLQQAVAAEVIAQQLVVELCAILHFVVEDGLSVVA
jgi:hypothetical protein